MNNLVSKSPVQRFKQGKRILKAQYGTETPSLGLTYSYEFNPAKTPQIGNQLPNFTEVQIPKLNYDPKIALKNLSSKKKIIKRSGVDKNGNPVRWNEDENGNFISGQYVSDDGNTYWQGSDGSKTLIKRGNQKTVNSPETVTKQPFTKSLPTRKTPVTKFKGTVAGGQVLARGNNLSNVISNDQRAQLINSGAFNNADFSDVRTFQNALNRYFAKDGYGSILLDNMWGNQTATAFQEALRKTKSPIVNTQNGVLIQNGKTAKDLVNDAYFFDVRKPTSPITTQTPTITNLPTKPIRSGNYNKSQIRKMISEGGFNPYNYTGAQRKALRLYLNGESDDTSLLDGTDLARFTLPFRKQGGQLISRNPVERFKNKKI